MCLVDGHEKSPKQSPARALVPRLATVAFCGRSRANGQAQNRCLLIKLKPARLLEPVNGRNHNRVMSDTHIIEHETGPRGPRRLGADPRQESAAGVPTPSVGWPCGARRTRQ